MSSLQMKSPSSEGELLDDWEQMADSGLLDQKLQSIKPRIPEEVKPPLNDTQPTHFLFNGDGSIKPTVLGHTPQIKILKRPQHNTHGHHHGHHNIHARPKVQVKTLQQKEAEYAEARLRILGEAAPAPTPDVSLNKLQSRMENLRTEESCLIRLPRGPDGTKGFNQQN
uniref:SUZ RNA-binding domain-containing n=1 Tax=Moina brachiata TaxID=675436 RepID=A0A4Y7NMG9_9CRUS|nr:EOG090X0RU6 [Moina brachiata]